MKAIDVPVQAREEVPAKEPAGAFARYGKHNLIVLAAQLAGWAFLLTLLDQSFPFAVRVLLALGFGVMMQGVFTMLHEFCHGNAHGDARLNYAIGWGSATLFGTIPTLVQVQHWGHHRRNRTESERGEFIHEDESPFGKTVRYYVAILGGLWLVCPLVALLVPFLPFSAARRLAADRRFNTYAAAFLDFDAASWQRMRLEGLLFWCVWGALLVWGPWSPATLAVAYGSFAFSWSTLQWIYHVNTPIHVVEGAYNLRLPTPLRWLFLNFNYNLTHHRHPYLSWQELPKHTDLVETQPMWYRYVLIFRPPRPLPEDFSSLDKRYF